jgi:hypothetical protein
MTQLSLKTVSNARAREEPAATTISCKTPAANKLLNSRLGRILEDASGIGGAIVHAIADDPIKAKTPVSPGVSVS